MPAAARTDLPLVGHNGGEQYEERSAEWGDMQVAHAQFPAMNLAPLLKGLPDDRCQCPHWGHLFKAGSWSATLTTRKSSRPVSPSTWLPGTRQRRPRIARSCRSARQNWSARPRRSSVETWPQCRRAIEWRFGNPVAMPAGASCGVQPPCDQSGSTVPPADRGAAAGSATRAAALSATAT
jgi:hypothetical protein